MVLTLASKLVEHAPNLITAGLNLLTSLAKSIIDNRDKLFESAVSLVTSLAKGLIENAPQILSAAAELVFAIAKGIITGIPKILTAMFDLISSLKDAFFNTDWSSIGSNIVGGVWNGITGLWGDLVGKVQEAVNNLWASAKRALGISSPSKKFKYIGEMSVEGIEEGFEDGEQDLTRTVNTIYTGMLQAAGGAAAAVPSARDFESAVSYNLSATGGDYTVVVPLYLDGREIARATAWSMGQQLAWEEI
jgi:phage-related protein